MTPPTVQFIPASGEDWDTYAIAYSNEVTANGSNYLPASPAQLIFTPTGTAFEPNQVRAISFGVQVRDGNTSSSYVTDVPFVALWNKTTQTWTVHNHISDNGTVQRYSGTPYEPSGTTYPANGEEYRIVGLSQYTNGAVDTWNNF